MLPSSRNSDFLQTFARRLGAAGAAGVLIALTGCGSGVQELSTGSNASAAPVAIPQGPQLGYAWKADDQTLRPLLGVPGSAQIGASVVPAGTYVEAGASAASSLAVLIGADGKVYTMTLPAGTPVQTSVTAAAGSVVRMSPSGVAAVVFVPGSQTAVLLTSLGAGVKPQTVAAGAALAEMAVNDAGVVAGILESAKGTTVNLLSGSPQQLAALSGAGSLSFAGTSDTLLAADASANSLVVIRSVASTPLAAPVATGGLLKSPAGVGASFGGRWAVVANGGDASIVRIDLSGATAPLRIASPAQPAVVQQLAGGGVFRFTEIGASSAPVWIADITASSPAMMFIPALQAAGVKP
jgi:hypothetical protein